MNDKKPVNIFAITTILLLISTIILGLILGKLIITRNNEAEPAVAETPTISEEDIRSLKAEEREDILSDMKLRLVNGEGSLSIFKSYFPLLMASL